MLPQTWNQNYFINHHMELKVKSNQPSLDYRTNVPTKNSQTEKTNLLQRNLKILNSQVNISDPQF